MQTAGHNIVKTEGVIISRLVADYLDSLRLRGLSPKSIQIYSRALDRFLQFLKKQERQRIQDVTAADLEAYRLALVDGNLAPASIEMYLRGVRQFFAWLESSQILFLNPAAGLVIPKPERKLLPVPSEQEIRRLLAQPDVNTRCGLRDRALLETTYSTGARAQRTVRPPGQRPGSGTGSGAGLGQRQAANAALGPGGRALVEAIY